MNAKDRLTGHTGKNLTVSKTTKTNATVTWVVKLH